MTLQEPTAATTATTTQQVKELHIAPMIRFSDRDFRAFLRILSKRCVLWTEMMADNTVIHMGAERRDAMLGLEDHNHPVVVQIGGNDVDKAAVATRILQGYGYDEVNLNCGCPSERVAKKNDFGAALMKRPLRMAQIAQSMSDVVHSGQQVGDDERDSRGDDTDARAMEEQLKGLCMEEDQIGMTSGAQQIQQQQAESEERQMAKCSAQNKLPKISIKMRIGVDDDDSSEFLREMIQTVVEQCDCRRFFMHARKVHLRGLNAKQNRTVPPLNYARVFEMCRLFPQADFWLNGGVLTLREAKILAYGMGVVRDKEARASKRLIKVARICDLVDAEGKVKYAVMDADREDEKKQNDDARSRCGNPQSAGFAVVASFSPSDACAPFSDSTMTQPLHVAPPNLRGCMLGRAALNNVAMFADADRYFYEDPAGNPCHNRRQALEQYCEYLELNYPRRCCDADLRVTSKFPPPSGIQCVAPHCDVCEPIYGKLPTRDYDASADVDTTCTKSSDPGTAAATNPSYRVQEAFRVESNDDPKIAGRIAANALKPTLSLFAGLPCNKQFRHVCERLLRDETIRNCGPAHMLRLAMQELPDVYLDLEFGVVVRR